MKRNNKKIPNVPHLRFKEFSGEWEKCKIKEILKIKSGKDQKKIEKSNGKYFIYGTGGIIGKTDTFLYDKESVGIGRKGTIDKPVYFNKPFWTVDTLFYSEINKNYYVKFVYYLFETINWKMYDESTGVPSLSSSTIESIGVYITDKEEQQKIATFLTLIDKRIETQMRIIEEYKSLIKGIREKIFISLKHTKPYRLKEIASLYQPRTISKSQMNSRSNYYVYGANGIIGKTNNFNHFTKQICVGCRGTVGNVFITNEKAWINGNAMVVNVDTQTEIVNKMYLYYYLKNCNFKNIVSGSSQPQIVRGSLENYTIELPNIKEQNQIQYLLSSFEKIAAIENKKLNNYIAIKKFLLNNLFI